MDFHSNMGVIAAIVASLGLAVYIWSTVKGPTKPNPATWWIWTLCGLLIALTYDSAGAHETRWVPWVYVVGPLFAAIFSLRYGVGGWTWFDRFCILGAVVSAVVWLAFGQPVLALVMSLIMDFFGLLPTVRKSWWKPEQENRTAWFIATVANGINLFAVKTWTFAIAVHPLYMTIACGLVTLLLILRPRSDTPKRD